jgi:hypothetical protein
LHGQIVIAKPADGIETVGASDPGFDFNRKDSISWMQEENPEAVSPGALPMLGITGNQMSEHPKRSQQKVSHDIPLSYNQQFISFDH